MRIKFPYQLLFNLIDVNICLTGCIKFFNPNALTVTVGSDFIEIRDQQIYVAKWIQYKDRKNHRNKLE